MSRTPGRIKDILLEHISRDIKKLQSLQSDMSTVVDMVTNSSAHAHSLCEHLDHVLMHGLREYDRGYWPFVTYFTRSEAIHTIKQLSQVTTDIGRGRAWLYMALNEQVVESYVRMFLENQQVAQEYYMRESFMRDTEHLLLLQTLVSGLDFISFDLTLDCSYLDYGASEPSSRLGIDRAAELTPDVEPSFVSSVTPETRRKFQGRSVSGVLDNVFGYESPPPTNREDILPVSYSGASAHERGRRSPDRSPRSSLVASGREEDEEEDGRSQTVDIPSSRERKFREVEPSSSLPSLSSPASQGNILERMAQQTQQRSHSRSKIHKHKSHSRSKEDRLTQSLVVRGSDSHSRGQMSQKDNDDWDEPVVQSVKAKKPKSKKKKRKKAGEKESPKAGELSRGTSPGDLSMLPEGEPEADTVGATPQLGMERGAREGEEEEDMAAIDPFTLSPSTSHYEQTEDLTPSSPPPELTSASVTEPSALTEQKGSVGGEDMDVGEHQLLCPTLPLSAASPTIAEEAAEEAIDGGVTLRVEEEEVWEEEKGVRVSPSLRVVHGLSLEDEMRHLEPPGPRGEEDLKRGEYGMDTPSSPPPPRLTLSPALDDFEIISSGELYRSGEEERVREGRSGNNEDRGPSSLVSPITEIALYEGLPDRPKELSRAGKHAADVDYDDNTRIVFQLDVFLGPDEQIERLVQVTTPTGMCQRKTAYLLITTEVVYLLRREGIEGHYSREVGIRFSEFEHIVIGLGWQSLILVYCLTDEQETQQFVITTESEAVSRSIVDAIRVAAATCPNFQLSIPLNRDDEARVEAIERELIKLGSHTSMDIVQYSLVNWEDISAEDPLEMSAVFNQGVSRSGTLLVKSSNVLGMSIWKAGYFKLRDGMLRQYNSETDKVARFIYDLGKCGGCTRAHGESKPFAISISGREGLVVAAASEEELTQWMQSLCEAVTSSRSSPLPDCRRTCLSCAVLLTQNKVHVLQEDWTNQTAQLVTSCEITDVNRVSVDKTCPRYCTISHDQGDSQGVWLLCFSSEYELGKFEFALAARWKEHFQIDLQFTEVSGREVKERAHRAIELMQWSRLSSDSVSRGRTGFSYDPTF